MALSADTIRDVRTRSIQAFKVLNTSVIYKGSQTSIAGPTHATGASQGYSFAYTGAAGEIPVGFSDVGKTGDTSASPVVENYVSFEGVTLEQIAVTGVSAITDIGKPIYMSDDGTFTLTRPTRGIAFGVVIRWHSSTSCDAFFFSFEALLNQALAGNGQETLFLGQVDFGTSADGNIRTAIPAPYHGEILEVYGMVARPMTGTSGSILLNLEIDGTNVTGGVVTMSTAAGGTLGTKLAGTAVTAENVFHEGSLIDIEGSSAATTRTLGQLDLFATVLRRFGV